MVSGGIAHHQPRAIGLRPVGEARHRGQRPLGAVAGERRTSSRPSRSGRAGRRASASRRPAGRSAIQPAISPGNSISLEARIAGEGRAHLLGGGGDAGRAAAGRARGARLRLQAASDGRIGAGAQRRAARLRLRGRQRRGDVRREQPAGAVGRASSARARRRGRPPASPPAPAPTGRTPRAPQPRASPPCSPSLIATKPPPVRPSHLGAHAFVPVTRACDVRSPSPCSSTPTSGSTR